MAYYLVPDILGAMILAATFVLCLRSFRREDYRGAPSLSDRSAAGPPRAAGESTKSLAELLNLMDESVGRSSGVFARPSSASPLNVMEGIEVTVRVNTQRTSGASRPVASPDVVNAEWEPVSSEIAPAGRPTLPRIVRR